LRRNRQWEGRGEERRLWKKKEKEKETSLDYEIALWSVGWMGRADNEKRRGEKIWGEKRRGEKIWGARIQQKRNNKNDKREKSRKEGEELRRLFSNSILVY
jgi:hypothetical protein